MSCRRSTRELVAAYRAGDQTAATEIHDRFEKLLRAYADKEIGNRLRRHVDLSGILQSAWLEFFSDVCDNRIDVNNSNHARNLLARKTWWRIIKATKRPLPPEPASSLEVADKNAPPEVVAALFDELTSLLSKEDPRDAEVVGMALQGLSSSEIAERVHVSRWTVRRVRERFGKLLRKRFREYSNG